MTVDKTRHQSGKYNHNVVPTAMATLIQIGKANLLFQEKVSTPKHFQWVWLDTLSKWLYPGLITAAVYRCSLCLQLSAQDVCESCHLILTGSCHLILTGSGKSWSATHKNITTLPPPFACTKTKSILPPSAQIQFTPTPWAHHGVIYPNSIFSFHENRLFMTFIKNVCQLAWQNNSHPPPFRVEK